MLFWGGPDGFSSDNRWETVAAGPSGMNVRDPGNSIDRGLYEDYVSSAYRIEDDQTPASLSWQAETLHGTSVAFQIRTAGSENDLQKAVWKGPEGKNSWFTKSGSGLQSMKGGWIQYRARLITPDGGNTPYLVSVTIEFH
jgi:hypothetical protein